MSHLYGKEFSRNYDMSRITLILKVLELAQVHDPASANQTLRSILKRTVNELILSRPNTTTLATEIIKNDVEITKLNPLSTKDVDLEYNFDLVNIQGNLSSHVQSSTQYVNHETSVFSKKETPKAYTSWSHMESLLIRVEELLEKFITEHHEHKKRPSSSQVLIFADCTENLSRIDILRSQFDVATKR